VFPHSVVSFSFYPSSTYLTSSTCPGLVGAIEIAVPIRPVIARLPRHFPLVLTSLDHGEEIHPRHGLVWQQALVLTVMETWATSHVPPGLRVFLRLAAFPMLKPGMVVMDTSLWLARPSMVTIHLRPLEQLVPALPSKSLKRVAPPKIEGDVKRDPMVSPKYSMTCLIPTMASPAIDLR
jgi:hypothetical protein